jgi:glycosyltransferase involved in cell wall biosynthesis
MAPWGVDTTIFHPAKTNTVLRGDFGLGPGPVVLSLRPIRTIYNPLDIAKAIPAVLRSVPDTQFVVRTYAYDKDLLDRFQAIVDDHNVRHAVHYVGDLPNDYAIASLYRLADVAVSVPLSDGTPLSVLEALACGAAPILSDLPSLREWVRHENEGLFVPVGDIQAISSSIVRLLTDKKLRHQLKANGIELIRQRADSRVWMAHAEDLYRRLVSQHKGR